MSLKPLEDSWKVSLTEILEQLDELQYKKMLVALDLIPKAVKTGKSRLDLTHLVIQYYGTIESIHTITKILDEIPRRDAAVRDPLRLAHQELENYTKQKGKKTTASVKKKPTAEKKKSRAPPVGQTKGNLKSLMKSKSVDVAEPSYSAPVSSKRKFDEAEAVRVKMTKDESALSSPQSLMAAAQQSEATIQSSSKIVGMVKPQKTAILQKQSPLVEVLPEQVLETIRLVVVKEAFKKKVYVFAEHKGSMRELEVTPRRLAVALGLNQADPDFKNHLHRQLPAFVNVQLNGKTIVKIERSK